MATPLTVFYSYAHKDEVLRDKLEAHLSSLQEQNLISGWHDRQIVAGTEWAYAINSNLQTASIILLLISPAFMASDYCVSIEMQQAMERHRLGDARVIPIILEPATWQDAPFASLQCLPRGAKPIITWDNPEDAFENVVQGLRRAIEEINAVYSSSSPLHPSEPVTLPVAADPRHKEHTSQAIRINAKNRQRMLERVHTRWIAGLLKNSLNKAALLTLDIKEQPGAVANPWSFTLQEMNQPARLLRPGTRIIQAYDYAGGELLILGEPGAGKTTLLLELTRDLIERARRDETHPIPVVFNLSSWSLIPQPIADWLAEEMFLKYQIPRTLGKSWIEAEQILPLLDGLDEVAPNKRADCMEALNKYKQDHGLLPMVICSRTADYLAQQSRVLLRTAIVIQPLTPAQIELYLASAKQQLAPVREVLQADTELQELASTPLMLSILALTYHGSSLSELLKIASPLARRQQIFATYVQRMLQRRGKKEYYTSQQTLDWLGWLAQQMRQSSQSEFFLERMQPDWLPERHLASYYWSLSLVTGLIVGLDFGLGGWIFGGLLAGLLAGLGMGGIYFLLGIRQQGRLSIMQGEIVIPAEMLTWSWEKARDGLLGGLIAGLGTCLFGVLFAWLRGELGVGLGVGLGIGLVGGLLAGLLAGLFGGLSKRRLIERLHLAPNGGIWRSARNGLGIGLFGGLGVGLVFGLGIGLFGGLGVGLRVGLYSGLSFVLFGGLVYGLDAVVQHFALRLWLWRARVIPWRYVRFLNYAADCILLRQVGGSYIFVHRLLQEHFAASDAKPTSPSGT